MKRIASLGFAVSALALATACSGGGTINTNYPGQQTIPATATPAPPASPAAANVVFLVTVPTIATTSGHRRPNVAAPAGTQSVSVILDSVNGTAVSNAKQTVQNTTVGSSGCTTAGNQLVCQFSVTAPAGNDVFSMKMFSQQTAGGNVVAAGDVAVTAASGQNTIAPTVLTGTVASIAITAPVLPAGVSGSGSLVIAAKDAKGNTILGEYANAIALSLTDSSKHTTLSATSVPDSTTAANIMLTYDGGAMSKAATIGATSSGVAGSAVTPGTFMPDATYPTVNGSTSTYAVSLVGGTSVASATPTPGPTATAIENVSVATGANFNGLSNLTAVTVAYTPGPISPAVTLSGELFGSPDGTSYYQWTNGNATSALQFVGSQGQSLEFPAPVTVTCAAPYSTKWIAPLQPSWDALSGTGACVSKLAFDNGAGDSESISDVANADGSYTANAIIAGSGLNATEALAVNANGTAMVTLDSEGPPGSPPFGKSVIISVGTPAPGAPSIPVTLQTYPGSIPNPLPSTTPAPVQTSIPNWYVTAKVPNGTIPSPLQSDAYRLASTNAPLERSCAVDPSIVPTGTKISNVTETFTQLDPLSGYDTSTTQWYLVNGLGVVCEVQNVTAFVSGDVDSLLNVGPTVDSWVTFQESYSLTASSLQAAMAKTRSFAQAAGAAQTQMIAFAANNRNLRLAHLVSNIKRASLKAHHR